MKKVLIIIVIIILLIAEVSYCIKKKSDEKREVKVELTAADVQLKEINKELTNYEINILSMWEDASNGGSINKEQMANITEVKPEVFKELTKELSDETYSNGLEAAKVESLYYKNSGAFKGVQERLDSIKTILNTIKNKKSVKYKKISNAYEKMNDLLEILENPNGTLLEYRQLVYSKNYNVN